MIVWFKRWGSYVPSVIIICYNSRFTIVCQDENSSLMFVQSRSVRFCSLINSSIVGLCRGCGLRVYPCCSRIFCCAAVKCCSNHSVFTRYRRLLRVRSNTPLPVVWYDLTASISEIFFTAAPRNLCIFSVEMLLHIGLDGYSPDTIVIGYWSTIHCCDFYSRVGPVLSWPTVSLWVSDHRPQFVVLCCECRCIL